MDRTCDLPVIGELDKERGEFWVENPFLMDQQGDNLSAFERNCVFLNLDGTEFIDASFASHADIDSDSRSVLPADMNGDGATDLLVASVGGGPLRLFLNQFPRRFHSVRIDLKGTESNASAIGTRVIIEAGDKQIVRDRFPANGCLGQAPPEMIVGLGSCERIDRLTVRWPTGRTQSFEDLPVDVRLSITEGEAEIATVGEGQSP